MLVMTSRTALVFAAVSCLATDAISQDQINPQFEPTSSGRAYEDAIRFRGIDSNIRYFDPELPAPSLDTRKTPDPKKIERTVGLDPEDGSLLANILAVVVLLGVVFLFFRFGGGVTVSMRQKGDTSRIVRGTESWDDDAEHMVRDLEAISKIPDLKIALITLAQTALMRAISHQGLLLQKSWTARDALRRLPKDMEHRDALSDLVAMGERVLFGGRDVSREELDAHIQRIRPIFRQVAP